MKRLCCLLGLLIVLPVSLQARPFRRECPIPYNSPAVRHAIDRTCSKDGDISATDTDDQDVAHRVQNDIKNNLCASGTPKPITLMLLHELQDKIDHLESSGILHYGDRENLPIDRTPLHGIETSAGSFSEGDLVELEAVLVVGKRGSSSESCNCGSEPVIDSDVHIGLGRTADDDGCDQVVAEMIPHWRPASWYWTNLKDLQGSTVRITGQLFFDASHHPCGPHKRSSDPDRFTVWEIHPVYTVLVKDEAETGTIWQPLHRLFR